MQQFPDLTQLPGATVQAKVEWQTLVPLLTSLMLVAPEVSGSQLPALAIAYQGDRSELVTLKVAHLGEAMKKGVQFDVCRADMTIIGKGIVQ